MDEYLIEKFWDDYFKYPGQRQTSFALKNLLKGFREILSHSSKTAYSIATEQPLERIIKNAREEKLIEFAKTVNYAKDHLGYPYN